MTKEEYTTSLIKIERGLTNYARSLTKCAEEADDLIQNTILRAFENLEKFQSGTNFRAWMYTIMRNIFITDYNRKKRFTKIQSEQQIKIVFDKNNAVQNSAVSDISIKELKIAIENLEPEHRIPFLMVCEGFKYHEIAEKLQKPMGTIKNRVFLARQKLKEFAVKNGLEPEMYDE